MKLDPAKIALSNKRADTPSRKPAFRREGVRDSVELKRIAALPRRPEELASPEDCAALSALLRADTGTMTLNQIQATFLGEVAIRGAGLGSICAGGGKTLLSYLLGRVLYASRVVVLVPSGLVSKTLTDFRKLSHHFEIPHRVLARDVEGAAKHERILYVLGYELLGLEQSAETLRTLAPDLIVADEAQRLKNQRAACTRRVRRYLDERPQTVFVPFSGTILGGALAQAAHLYDWALGAASPLPRRFVDVAEWGLAIDTDVPSGSMRFAPGALKTLYGPAELAMRDEVAAARVAVQRRVRETPGIVATADSFVGASLRVNVVPLEGPRPAVDAALELLDERWVLPDGEPVSDAATKWRHQLEIGSGFFYVWDPRPPKDWLEARRTWKRVVRHILGHNQRELDSELQVTTATLRGDFDGVEMTSNGLVLPNAREALRTWTKLEPLYRPDTRAEWLDDAVLEYVRAWLSVGPGLVFVGAVALGRRVSDVLGATYYGQGGLSATGARLEDTRPGSGPVVCSLAANYTGRNLQAWDRALVLPGTGTAALNGAMVEQLLARLHREGQRSDEVTFDLLITCGRAYDAYLRTLEQAQAAQDVSGQQQRILFADVVDSVVGLTGVRWDV